MLFDILAWAFMIALIAYFTDLKDWVRNRMRRWLGVE